jgi:hypothetical protein
MHDTIVSSRVVGNELTRAVATVVPIIGALLLLEVPKGYHKKHGLDLSRGFSEIPPE